MPGLGCHDLDAPDPARNRRCPLPAAGCPVLGATGWVRPTRAPCRKRHGSDGLRVRRTRPGTGWGTPQPVALEIKLCRVPGIGCHGLGTPNPCPVPYPARVGPSGRRRVRRTRPGTGWGIPQPVAPEIGAGAVSARYPTRAGCARRTPSRSCLVGARLVIGFRIAPSRAAGGGVAPRCGASVPWRDASDRCSDGSFPCGNASFPHCDASFPCCDADLPRRNGSFPCCNGSFPYCRGSFPYCDASFPCCNAAFPCCDAAFPCCDAAFPCCNEAFPCCNAAFPPCKTAAAAGGSPPPGTGAGFAGRRGRVLSGGGGGGRNRGGSAGGGWSRSRGRPMQGARPRRRATATRPVGPGRAGGSGGEDEGGPPWLNRSRR